VKQLALMVPGALDQLTGGYLYARRLVDGLRALGHDVEVHELAGEFPLADPRAHASCAATLASLGPGAVAVIDGLALPGFAPAIAREAGRLRLLALVHHPLAAETGLGATEQARLAALEAALLPLFAGIICPSTTTAAAIAAYGIAPARIGVVAPGTIKPLTPRARVFTPRAPLALLSVATVTPRKGHRVLIEALGRQPRRDWRLTIIGSLERDPEETEAVRQAIASHGLAELVTLAGEWPHDRLGAAYEAADVFVLASYHEGYGMAFAEALAHGLPIIATSGGATPETVPASAGLLVPPGDGTALAAALARIIADAALRATLAAGAAAAGASLPDWDETVRRWRDTALGFLA
jgi:glycosyltransferase involved in cell wall biosynthesis